MSKRIVLYLCFLAVLAAGAVAIYPGVFGQPAAAPVTALPEAAPEPEEDPLVAFRTEREQLRAMQMASLNDIVYGDRADDEIRALAQRKLIEISDWSEKELTIEGVLKARGYRDAIATVHADSANVLVRAEALNRQESAVILELVVRETGLGGGNVKIIPIN